MTLHNLYHIPLRKPRRSQNKLKPISYSLVLGTSTTSSTSTYYYYKAKYDTDTDTLLRSASYY